MPATDATTMEIEVFGLRWRIDLSTLYPQHAELAARVKHLWARARVTPTPDSASPAAPTNAAAALPAQATSRTLDFKVLPPGTPIPRDDYGMPLGVALGEPQSLPYALSRSLTLASISARRGEALMLHAAGLAVPTPGGPRALVLVAASGTGKSTAARTFGPRWGYLSDESVVIERDLTISPYTKPISLAAVDRPGDKDELSPDDLGLAVAPPGCRVGAIVLMQRSENATEPTLQPIGLIDGILGLFPESSSIRALPRPLQWMAEALTTSGGPYLLEYSNIVDCGPLLEELASLIAAPDPGMTLPWTGHSPNSPARTPPSPATPSGECPGVPRSARADWVDAVESEGEVLVLRGAGPARLAGIGATMWASATAPFTVREMERVVVAAHGANPQQRARTAMAIEDLLREGLFVRSTTAR